MGRSTRPVCMDLEAVRPRQPCDLCAYVDSGLTPSRVWTAGYRNPGNKTGAGVFKLLGMLVAGLRKRLRELGVEIPQARARCPGLHLPGEHAPREGACAPLPCGRRSCCASKPECDARSACQSARAMMNKSLSHPRVLSCHKLSHLSLAAPRSASEKQSVEGIKPAAPRAIWGSSCMGNRMRPSMKLNRALPNHSMHRQLARIRCVYRHRLMMLQVEIPSDGSDDDESGAPAPEAAPAPAADDQPTSVDLAPSMPGEAERKLGMTDNGCHLHRIGPPPSVWGVRFGDGPCDKPRAW